MTTWHCEICNVYLKPKSKYAHLKSKKHMRNTEISNVVDVVDVVDNMNSSNFPDSIICERKHEDCVICCESSNVFEKCKGCKQEWCIRCDGNIFECPYCRRSIDGREDRSMIQKRENYQWQVNDDAFRPNQNNSLNRWTFTIGSMTYTITLPDGF